MGCVSGLQACAFVLLACLAFQAFAPKSEYEFDLLTDRKLVVRLSGLARWRTRTSRFVVHDTLSNQLRTETQFNQYRLADCVRFNGRNVTACTTDVRDSFVRQVHHKAKSRNSDYTQILTDLIKNKKPSKICQSSETVVLHLRVGDVLDKPSRFQHMYNLQWCLSSQCYYHHVQRDNFGFTRLTGIGQYVLPWKTLYALLNQLPAHVSQVVIIAGSHAHHLALTQSSLYVECVATLLRLHGYTVTLQLGNDPDADFVDMVHAPHFVTSGGGFGKLVQDCRKRLNKPNIEPNNHVQTEIFNLLKERYVQIVDKL